MVTFDTEEDQVAFAKHEGWVVHDRLCTDPETGRALAPPEACAIARERYLLRRKGHDFYPPTSSDNTGKNSGSCRQCDLVVVVENVPAAATFAHDESGCPVLTLTEADAQCLSELAVLPSCPARRKPGVPSDT